VRVAEMVGPGIVVLLASAGVASSSVAAGQSLAFDPSALVGNLTGIGAIIWVVRHMLVRTLPETVSRFTDTVDQTTASFREELRAERTAFREELREEREALRGELRAGREAFSTAERRHQEEIAALVRATDKIVTLLLRQDAMLRSGNPVGSLTLEEVLGARDSVTKPIAAVGAEAGGRT